PPVEPARPLPPARGANRRRHSRPAAAMQVPAGPSGRMRGKAAARSSNLLHSGPYTNPRPRWKRLPRRKTEGGSGGGHQWEYLVRVQQPVGIEGGLDAALLIEVGRGELDRHEIALFHADPVLPGEAAAHFDAELQDVGAERFGLVHA